MIPDDRPCVLPYLSLVEPIARRIAKRLPPSYEIDDLIQTGYLGLLYAAASYHPERGSFAWWARLRIRGAIIDSVRREWRDSTAVELEELSAITGQLANRPPPLLAGLTTKQHKLLTLIYVMGESCEEIGRRRVFGVGPRATQVLHRQALLRLRKINRADLPPEIRLDGRMAGKAEATEQLAELLKPDPPKWAEKIDRLGYLEARLAPYKADINEAEKLRKEIGESFVGAADASGRIDGKDYFSTIAPRGFKQRLNMRRLAKAITHKVFFARCGFTIEAFEELIPKPDRSKFVVNEQVGPRKVETFHKIAA